MAKTALQILQMCKECDRVPKSFPDDPMYHGGIEVFIDPANYNLTDVETEIVSTSQRREAAGLGPTLANTDVTEINAHLVAIIYKAGLEVDGRFDANWCCGSCVNRVEYVQLYPSL